MAEVQATAMEVVSPGAACLGGATPSGEIHDKFLGEIGSLLEQLVRDNVPPPSATSQLREASSNLKKDYASLLQLALKKTSLKLLSGIAAEQDAGTLHARLSGALLVVDYANHFLSLPRPEVDASLPPTLLDYSLSFCTLRQIEEALPTLRASMEAIGAVRSAANVPSGGKMVAKLRLLQAAQTVVLRDNAMTDPAFSGRLRIALASALPVWDLSGVNKKGSRARNNVQFSDEASFVAALKADLAARAERRSGPSIDFVLYRTFWSLQAFMEDPFGGDFVATWPEACKVFNNTVAALEATPISSRVSQAPPSGTPRYLTAPCLLPLQFADAGWRRGVLTQFLVFLLHTRLMGEDVTEPKGDKSRWSARRPFCAALFAPGGDGARLHARVLKLLRADGDGDGYASHVVELLDAERFWVTWKLKRACKNLERPATETTSALPLKRRRLTSATGLKIDGDAAEEPRGIGSELWTSRVKSFNVSRRESMMTLLLARELPSVPAVDNIRRTIEEDKAEEDVSMHRANDPKFEWLALRALRMNHLRGIVTVASEKAKFGVDLSQLLSNVNAAETSSAMAMETVKPAEAKERISETARPLKVEENVCDGKKDPSNENSLNETPACEKPEASQSAPAKVPVKMEKEIVLSVTDKNGKTEKTEKTSPAKAIKKDGESKPLTAGASEVGRDAT